MNRLEKAMIEARAIDNMNREVKFNDRLYLSDIDKIKLAERVLSLLKGVDTDTIATELERAHADSKE